MDTLTILGIPIHRVDMEEAVSKASEALETGNKFFIVTPNSEIVYLANKNPELKAVIEKSDMTVPDGIGLVLGSKIVGKPLKERVTGIDLMEELLQYANQHGKSIYLLGGKEGVAKEAAENIQKKYPQLIIAGYHNGYFKGLHTGHTGHEEELQVLKEINQAAPDILFVALGAPKQEFFIDRYKEDLAANLFIGVGGSLDVYSGRVERAPEIYRKLGLEWFYRLKKEPWRIKRMSALPLFLIQVIRKKDKPIHKGK